MLNVLFALNQNTETVTEETIIKYCSNFTDIEFSFSKEYDLTGVRNRLTVEKFDCIILNEELERDNLITTTYIDEITDKYSELKIVLVVSSEHEKDQYIKRLFNIGIYDLIYTHDISVENIANLIVSSRTKAEAKTYLGLHDVEDAFVESELVYIPEEQLYNIISFLEKTEKENIVNVYERVYDQYNEKQIIHLHTHLPDDIKEALEGNAYFDEISKKINMESPPILSDEVEITQDNNTSKMKKPTFKLNILKPNININASNESTISDRLIGSVYIGVANSIRGSGSSFVSLAIGSYLNKLGFSVAVVEINSNPFFTNLSKDKLTSCTNINGIDVYYMDKVADNSNLFMPELKKNYQYIISDLGVVKLFINGTYSNNVNYKEFMRSTIKILMVSGCEWKWGEIYPFLINENIESWKLFVSPTSKKMKSIINKELSPYSKNIYHLPFIEDPFSISEGLIDIFDKSFSGYIGTKSKKLKFKLPGFSFGNKA